MSSFLTCQVKRISVEVGLPNITGKILTPNDWNDWGTAARGAFAGDHSKTLINGAAGTNAASRYYLDFNASRSSSVYQDNATVTPLSESTLYILKY